MLVYLQNFHSHFTSVLIFKYNVKDILVFQKSAYTSKSLIWMSDRPFTDEESVYPACTIAIGFLPMAGGPAVFAGVGTLDGTLGLRTANFRLFRVSVVGSGSSRRGCRRRGCRCRRRGCRCRRRGCGCRRRGCGCWRRGCRCRVSTHPPLLRKKVDFMMYTVLAFKDWTLTLCVWAKNPYKKILTGQRQESGRQNQMDICHKNQKP